ncbi:hypothetical protein [Glycomyces terrestris]|uniref:Uncharacterized protein n=1 Tax=Glycomyces terrestris TaxID=2493553 RepID=A0A426UT51_9ACTN|nr:hypothetical protein [Glycomyces terrestris]RRR96807.1 hypothetical protein EIW28_20375 [Glycomyces terrestris]
MSFPPPPPDRMHLQYQPAPPQQAGPGGAYGPVQQRPDQPVPGQLPPAEMTMAKPGTITGVQVILWIFTALAGLGDIAAAISLVEYFTPFGLIGLAWAAYSTVQALTSGIHITRGKRWAWIWSLVSSILGLAISAAAIVFGVVYIEVAALTLVIGVVLAGLYGTLLGLLCSKSARQWILMHRIRRGEVQVQGLAAGPGGPAQAAPADPQRPEKRPGAATFAVVAVWLLAALSAWSLVNDIRFLMAVSAEFYGFGDALFIAGHRPPVYDLIAHTVILVGALITAPLLAKGKSGGRVFGIVWSILATVFAGLMLTFVVIDYVDGYYDLPPLPGRIDPLIPAFGWTILRTALALLVFVLLLTPGVRAWTPGKPPSALIMVVPQPQGPYGQPGPSMPQQPGPYAPPRQSGPYGPPPNSGY